MRKVSIKQAFCYRGSRVSSSQIGRVRSQF
jgi:hypothetical protein